MMRRVFCSVGGFAFNSFSERGLVERTFPIAHLPSSVIGNAVVEGEGDPATARRALGLGSEEPFVLCVGRVERSKGSHALAEMWRLYRSRRPSAPRLVLLGPVNEGLESDAHVAVVGAQSEAVKWGALRGCQVLVNPSAFESFSLVLIESWLAGRPAIVNGRCEATVEQCRRGGGGLWFQGYADFEVLLDQLLADAPLRDRLARCGNRYARSTFAWDRILERYSDLADRIMVTRR
jgi:glycosyltransferase involved in cell wall biosynthesis